jgi:hypothetical protein
MAKRIRTSVPSFNVAWEGNEKLLPKIAYIFNQLFFTKTPFSRNLLELRRCIIYQSVDLISGHILRVLWSPTTVRCGNG